jgi:energy-coupling factor transporter transmembrane protein EcfT
MQSFIFSKKLSLALILCLGAAPFANAKEPKVPTSTFTKVVGHTVLATALITYLRLVTKKTTPKRVYPKDDSLKEQLWYLFDELLVGQAEKGERPDKLVINDENPNELVYKYSKVEARGVAGTLYSTLKPVIIPALTLMVLLNKSSEDVYCGIANMLKFATNPFQYFEELDEKCLANANKKTVA